MGKETRFAEEEILALGTSLLALTTGPLKSLPIKNAPELTSKNFAKSCMIASRCSAGTVEKLVDKTSPAQNVDFAFSSQKGAL